MDHSTVYSQRNATRSSDWPLLTACRKRLVQPSTRSAATFGSTPMAAQGHMRLKTMIVEPRQTAAGGAKDGIQASMHRLIMTSTSSIVDCDHVLPVS